MPELAHEEVLRIPPLVPYWRHAIGAELYLGHVVDVLRRMPARSVHCCVTSPPYWGLRDYQTGEWTGGSSECNHDQRRREFDDSKSASNNGAARDSLAGKDTCRKCGAVRVDQQLGLEASPDCLGWATGERCGACYVCRMTQVFSEVKRVLRDDGTLWLNLGDTYGGGGSKGRQDGLIKYAQEVRGASDNGPRNNFKDGGGVIIPGGNTNLKAGNLVGVPWRVALSLQADGWVMRNDVIWYSPNKMPESVTNRCTKSHEHIFLFAKSMGYYYDAEAIKEDMVCAPHKPGMATSMEDRNDRCAENIDDMNSRVWGVDGKKNKRDVWVVPTRGYAGAHFATYPPALITPCILAGTSEYGCCAKCGAPWGRVVERVGGAVNEEADGDNRDRSFTSSRNGKPGSGSTLDGEVGSKMTVGWEPTCSCECDEVVPARVLDPFVGSGTTVATAVLLGRAGVGIDLSETYLRENAVPRVKDAIGAKQREMVESGELVLPPVVDGEVF